jgi:hypothetical protein
MVIIGLLYIGALTAGFLGVGFDNPTGDSALAIMEVLTLLSAPAMVIAIAVVHQWRSFSQASCSASLALSGWCAADS